jgi:protein-disulfide isomerase
MSSVLRKFSLSDLWILCVSVALVFLAGPAFESHALQLQSQALDPCGCEDKPLLDVLASVNGVKIRKQDLGAETQSRITTVQSRVMEARNRELDLQINNMLLEEEARKRGVSTAQLLQVEIVSKVPTPTDEDAKQFYDRNKQRIGKSFSEARPDILTLLRNQRQQQQALRFAASLRANARIELKVNAVTPPANEADWDRVLATVNGRNITSRDIEESLRPLIFNAQQQVYLIRKTELDMRINDLLLSHEAKRQGLSPMVLLQKAIRSKVPIVTEAQAQQYYNENRKQFSADFSAMKFQIIGFLMSQEEKKLSNEFAEQLRKTANLQIFLTAPESPTFRIATDDQPSRGNADAVVTVVQFTDFECPYCASQYPTLEKLMMQYENRVRFVIRDLPLSEHPSAYRAAEAAEAAREQGKYWDYIALLYNNPSALQIEKLKEYAKSLGLDRAKFDLAIERGRFSDKVQRDIDDANRLGVSTAPVFFVNGKRMADSSIDTLRLAIIAALETSRQ